MHRYLVIEEAHDPMPFVDNIRSCGMPAEAAESNGKRFIVWQTAPGANRPTKMLGREIQPISQAVIGPKGYLKADQTVVFYTDEPGLPAHSRRCELNHVTVFDIQVGPDYTEGYIDIGYRFLPVLFNCVDGNWHYCP